MQWQFYQHFFCVLYFLQFKTAKIRSMQKVPNTKDFKFDQFEKIPDKWDFKSDQCEKIPDTSTYSLYRALTANISMMMMTNMNIAKATRTHQ